MTLTDNMRLVIGLLTQGTREKKLQWTPNQDLTFFRAQVEDGVFELLVHPSGDGFNLIVRNNQNFVLEQTGYVSQKVSPELAELSREVRSSIPKTKEALQGIISGLRRKVTEP